MAQCHVILVGNVLIAMRLWLSIMRARNFMHLENRVKISFALNVVLSSEKKKKIS